MTDFAVVNGEQNQPCEQIASVDGKVYPRTKLPYSQLQNSLAKARRHNAPSGTSIAIYHYHINTASNYYIINVNMSNSAAAHTLLNVLAQPEASVVDSIATSASTAPKADSELSAPPPSAPTTLRSMRRIKRVQWRDTTSVQDTGRPTRSTRGVPPKRLADPVEAETSTRLQATTKRQSSTQPPQPHSKRSAVGRKALSNAANLIGKKTGAE